MRKKKEKESSLGSVIVWFSCLNLEAIQYADYVKRKGLLWGEAGNFSSHCGGDVISVLVVLPASTL